VVAGAVFYCLEQREDLLFTQNPLGECVLEFGPPDGGPDVEGIPSWRRRRGAT